MRIMRLFSVAVPALLCVGVGSLSSAGPADEAPQAAVVLDSIPFPPLPVPVDGGFVGLVDKRLVVAGGVSSVPPDGDLRKAEFLDTVYALAFDANGRAQSWELLPSRLDRPVAFGAAVESGDQLLLLGGMTADGPTDAVQAVAKKDGKLKALGSALAPLPRPLAFAGAARLGRDFNRVYRDDVVLLVGGMEHDRAADRWSANDTPLVYVLSVSPAGCHKLLQGIQRFALRFWPRPVPPTGWQPLSAPYAGYFPGQAPTGPFPLALVNPMLVVRKDFRTEKASVIVIGGLAPKGDGTFVPSPDVSVYVPGDKSFDGWRRLPARDAGIAPVSAVPMGAAHVVVWGARPAGPIRTAGDVARLRGEALQVLHTVTGTWVDLRAGTGLPPGGRLVPLPGDPLISYPHGRVAWIGDSAVQGRMPDGTGLATVVASATRDAHIHFPQRRFTGWDLLVIAVYLLGMLLVGNYFAKREKGTEDFFLGGRKIPGWAAGLSIYATGISAISFMAIPAKTFATNWDRVCLGIFPPITTYIAAYAFVPLLRGLKIMTMMEYFDLRFGRSIRYASSVLMIVGQIGGRMAVTLLLPSIAITAVTGMDVRASILVMGVIATVYTVMGGISAVIWTDVVQTFVIFGGALLALVVICFRVDGGLLGLLRVGTDPQFDKFTMFNWSFDMTVASVWVFTVWAITDLFGRLGQESLQRVLATPDERSAKRSLVISALISIPGTVLFYLIGTALFVFYRAHAHELDPAMDENAVLPFFVVQELPPGVSGLVIAGLFAAAMSTLDSGMNSVATVVVRDYYSLWRRDADDAERLKVAKWVTGVAGVLGTVMALYLAGGRSLGNLWDQFSKIMALIGGGFGGVIVLAMLTRRTSTTAMWIGIVAGTLMTVMMEVKALNYAFIFFVYGTLSTVVSVTAGWLASFVFPNRKDLTGLTVWTKRPRAGD